MVEPLFTHEKIEAMRPHIQKTVDSLLDVMVKEGCEKPVDLVDKFALPVPSYVSPSILNGTSYAKSYSCVIPKDHLWYSGSSV